MSFKANRLPPGLALNPQTGLIAGSVATRGTYHVQLTARNHRGAASRKLHIVVGETIALTPPMGWNSWYVLENRVTDRDIRAAAEAMVSSGLIQHGWSYVNIDDCWAVKTNASEPELRGAARDSVGRIRANQRFPDMKSLVDHIHALGLKAGIYTSPGGITCAGHAGSYQHEAEDARQIAEWGFDLLKYDWCGYDFIAKDHSLPELQKPYRLMGELLRQQPRDIVYNLCQYGMGDVWRWGRDVGGHCWRTANDLGLTFEGIAAGLFRDGFDVYATNQLHRFAGPGGWNDPDYLLLGRISNWKGSIVPTPLTPNEQYSQVSLWCLLAAPLIFSGDLTRLDEFTLSLLTNDEVIGVNQDPLGKPGRRVAKDGVLEVWARELEDGSQAVGLFNRGERATTVTVRWSDLSSTGNQHVRDLWRQQDLGVFLEKFNAPVGRHGVVLVRVSPHKLATPL